MEGMKANGGLWAKFFTLERDKSRHFCDYEVEGVEERDLVWFTMFLLSKLTPEGLEIIKEQLAHGLPKLEEGTSLPN